MICERCERRICAICGQTLPRRKGDWARTLYRGQVQDVHGLCRLMVRETAAIPAWLVPIYQERWALT